MAAPVDGHSLAVFRIWFGLMGAVWAFDYLRSGRLYMVCHPDAWHFTYPGFDWVRPWPGSGMTVHFVGMLVAGLLSAIGLAYRLAIFAFALGFTHFFLIDRTNYQNHYYFVMMLSWLMLLLPANRVWSFDRTAGKTMSCDQIPQWALLAVQFHVALPYVFGGIAKFEMDWLSSLPMRFMLLSKGLLSEAGRSPEGGVSALLAIASYGLAWGGLLFDLAIVPALIFPRTRRAAFAVVLLFHGANSVLFNIHIFPWLMIGASTIFFSPDWPCRFFGGRSELQKNLASAVATGVAKFRSPSAVTITVAGIYCLFHILWPFRHLLYSQLDPGLRTSWTEAGHYFSWRMMLRGKTSGVRYYLTDPVTEATVTADLRRVLSPEQLGKFARDPELVHQLAHLLADATEAAGRRRPQVRALVLTSLNGRKPQPLVDPTADLAATELHLGRKDWIMPLKEPLSQTPWTVPLDEWERHVELPDLPFLQPRTEVAEAQ